jgi:hypothetical protein
MPSAARILERQLAVQVSESEQTATTSWWVHMPGLQTRQLAERKQAELRALGVREMSLMPEPGDPEKLAISLGLFKTEAAAKDLLASLVTKGVRNARIVPRDGPAGRFRVELRGSASSLAALLDEAPDGHCRRRTRGVPMTFVVGLTGGIGSGKSSVADLFVQRGAGLVDTDRLAHALTAPQGAAIEPLRDAFGPDFITPQGCSRPGAHACPGLRRPDCACAARGGAAPADPRAGATRRQRLPRALCRAGGSAADRIRQLASSAASGCWWSIARSRCSAHA